MSLTNKAKDSEPVGASGPAGAFVHLHHEVYRDSAVDLRGPCQERNWTGATHAGANGLESLRYQPMGKRYSFSSDPHRIPYPMYVITIGLIIVYIIYDVY